MQPGPGEVDRLVEQRLAAVDVGRVEDARRQFAAGQGATHQVEAARPVAEVQVQDSSLARHQARDMGVGREAEQFVERRLTRAMIADGELADAEQRLEEHEVAADAARERPQRDVIATGVGVRIEAFLAQRVGGREQTPRAARHVVGTEQADHRGHACKRKSGQRHRRNARPETRLAAAAGDVHVTVDQAWNQALAVQDRACVAASAAGRSGSCDPGPIQRILPPPTSSVWRPSGRGA